MNDEHLLDNVMDALPDTMDASSLAALFACIAGSYGIEGDNAERFFLALADKSQEVAAAAQMAGAVERMKQEANE